MRSWLASLRVRFVFLVLVAVLPALGFLVYSASRQRDLAIAEAQDDTRRLADLAAADHGRLLEGTRQLLVVLARLPEVRGDAAACGDLMRGLRAEFPRYANLGVIAPDGAITCSGVPLQGAVNAADRDYFRRVLETRDFAVGEYQIGRVTGVPTVNGAYPVLDEGGRVTAVVYAALDLGWLNQFATEARLPEDSILTVLDRRGTVLVRRPDPDGLLGRSLVGTPVVDTILAEGAGVAEAPAGEGDPHLVAFAPLGDPAAPVAYLSIAVPKASAVAAADRAFNDSLTRLGLLTTVVLIAAWVGGDLLVRRDAEAHKAIVRRVYDAFSTGGVDLLDEAVDADFVDRDPLPGQAPGLAGLKQAVGLFRGAFPDGRLTAEELIAEGDTVVARVRLSGTQMGEFFGVPPSDRPVTAEGVETFRISGGKVVEATSRFGPLTPDADAT